MMYQINVKELALQAELIEKAIGVLKKFYESLNEKSGVVDTEESSSLLQLRAHEQPPQIFDGAYTGQKQDAEGGAIGMLEFILEDTRHQMDFAHGSEKDAQHDFEDDMTSLKEQQQKMQKSMVSLKNALAEAEKERIDKSQDLKQAKKDKKATEGFL